MSPKETNICAEICAVEEAIGPSKSDQHASKKFVRYITGGMFQKMLNICSASWLEWQIATGVKLNNYGNR